MKMQTCAMSLLFAMAFVGCTSIPVQQTVAKIAKPVLGLAAEDAATTLAWIDLQVTDGRLSITNAALAKQCPQAVADLAAYRDQMEAQKEVPGKKGLIYLATSIKYGATLSKQQVMDKVRTIIATCADLLPIEQVLGF